MALFALTFGAFVHARANDARIMMERENGGVDAQIDELDDERIGVFKAISKILNMFGRK